MFPSRRRAFVCSLKPIVAGAATLLVLFGNSCSSPTHPGNAVRVVLISLDGLRPDAVTATNTPTLVRLAKEGASTLNAQTVLPSLTLPAHTSMVTGLVPTRHGITWNDDTSAQTGTLTAPTIFDIAALAGYTSAMFVGKSKLSPIVHPGAPTNVNMPPVGQVWKADTVAAHVRAYLAIANAESKPNMMFIHLPDIDLAGHTSGWMSTEYVTAVRHTDSTVANILLALQQAFGSELVLIVTADHGGLGTNHSDGSQLARTVPWIAWGKDVSPRILTTAIRAVDAGPTMLWVLGLTPPTDWDGIPVKSAFQR
jgi:predicted AlkP superfamily pyrophosphatase or phosphodiesterase